MDGTPDIFKSECSILHAGTILMSSRPNYSSDWGDYINLATRMREKAEAEGNDLLLIDTGDRVEGNGLYDASEPKGEYTFSIFKEQHIDFICSGNHELYKRKSAENEYNITVPYFRGNYLASNLDIVDPQEGGLVPLAPRFRKFTTPKRGVRIMAMGFLFDFIGNSNNTFVQPVEDTVKEKWFQDAIRDREIDLFLIIGHVPVRSPEFTTIFKTIREVQWDTPIQFFGGHTHIRDYKKYDDKSYALESGRFMETIGFQSISGLSTKAQTTMKASPKFSRKYIDNNIFSFYHHTGLNLSTFATDHGRNVSNTIRIARKDLHLDVVFGCAPKDLWMFRARYPGEDNIYSWLEEQVLPDLVEDPERSDQPRLVVLNTGGIRFDIFKGPFTRDSTYIVSPFTGGFRVIKDVPYDKAKRLLEVLNKAGQILQNDKWDRRELAPPESAYRKKANFVGTTLEPNGQVHLGSGHPDSEKPLNPGYTTKDDDGSDGDDTLHSPLPFYDVPNCIQAEIKVSKSKGDLETVDVVYIEFIEPWVMLAFKFLGIEFSADQTAPYMAGKSLTELLAQWHLRVKCDMNLRVLNEILSTRGTLADDKMSRFSLNMPPRDHSPPQGGRSPSIISMHTVEPSPVEETPKISQSDNYFPNSHISSTSSSSSMVPKVLSACQKYSTYPFLAFAGLHITNTSIIPLVTRDVHAADNFLLLTRPYYQSEILEKAVVLAPIAVHAFSGILLRIYRRRQNARRHGASTHKERQKIPWPTLSLQSKLGYVFWPMLAGHIFVNRMLPLKYEGGSSGVGLRYVAHGFAKHPLIANAGYAVFVAAGVWHIIGGMTKWLKVSPEYIVEGGDYGVRKRRKRRRVISGVTLATYITWMAGGLGVVGRGGTSNGWEAKSWDELYRRIPLVGPWLA
ncbi:MAG: hypothetical protein Q9227_005500 [Pyrenula ochraceoflavens]